MEYRISEEFKNELIDALATSSSGVAPRLISLPKVESIEDSYVLAIVAYVEYITLLEAELSEVVPFMALHHWESHRTEAGILARKKIDDALLAVRTASSGKGE